MADLGVVLPGELPESLLRELQELDLSPYEARVLLALLRLGSGNSAQLARHSGVPRTSTYQVMEELTGKGLAQRMSVDGPATWSSPGRDETMERLGALLEERFRQQRDRTVKVRDLLDSTFPETTTPAAAYVHVLQAAQVATTYARLLKDTHEELLVFNRPPYSKTPEKVNVAALEAIARGADARALYVAEQWHDASAEAFRATMDEYHRAGVKGGLVDSLPVKLAISDRRAALVSMTDPVLPEVGFPTTLLVQHPGFAALQAEAFERLWEQAEMLEPPGPAEEPAPAPRVLRPKGSQAAAEGDPSGDISA